MFRTGKMTRLRPLEKEDAPQLKIWMNDPEVAQFLMRVFPVTLQEEEEWIENIKKRTPKDVVFGVETLEGTLIGTMGLHNIELIHGLATTGAVIGDKKFWGKGYGFDAKMLVLDFAFNTLSLRKVTSDVLAFNERSKRYLEKTGYKRVGQFKEHLFRDGMYHDLIIMEIFREEWLPLWGEYKKGL